jgi:hypothetical protein
MDQIELTVSPSQLRAIDSACRHLKQHLDEVLYGISQIKPIPDKPAAVPPDKAEPQPEAALDAASSSKDP